MDIDAYILPEYVPAKPLDTNLEVVFGTTTESNTCDQLNYDDSMKFPFIQHGYLPQAVNIKFADVLVHANTETQTKHVVEMALDTSALANTFSYAPGDTIAILPSNAYNVVGDLLQRLQLTELADLKCHISLAFNCAKKNAKVPGHIPPATTVREIFTHCLQLNGALQKQFLSALVNYTSDSKQRSFLASLSSRQGSAHYNEIILEKGLHLLDLLELCCTCKPSLALLVEHLPRLLPRPYSIANSFLEKENELRIIYSVLSHKPGTTTSMLESKRQQTQNPAKVLIYPRMTNAFRYTQDDFTCNQILIAVGTGLAPFLGFLAHKQRLQSQESSASGQTWLYVGAKTPQAILKADKLNAWQKSGVLQRLRMCYSRNAALKDEPKYVQMLLQQDASEFVEMLLKPTTVLYVCADGSKISQSISSGVCRCLQLILQLDEVEAMENLKELRKAGKYREDIWL